MPAHAPVEIRVLGLPDVPLLVAAGETVFDGPVIVAEAEAFFADPGHLLIGAIAEGPVLVGFLSAAVLRHPDKSPQVFVNEVGVAEPWRRRGIGAGLLETLKDETAGRGVVGTWLATEEGNAPARALYRAAGARETGGIVVYDWDMPEV